VTKEDDANNARYAEYRARERRTNIVMMAKRMFVLQVGHHGGLWQTPKEPEGMAEQHEVYRHMASEALAAAEAFLGEADKVLLP